ncbi:hypothetical protein CcaCcLH18_11710 [Colletotrichum camelliae]|nr:hypothetical protein CcaCcLH18_11710 [Colletotrichum camelliae]
MGQLSDALHKLVQETREMLAELTATADSALPDGPKSNVQSQLPAIPWSSIKDDHSKTKPGYSFLANNRNSWVSAGDGWLFMQLARSPANAERWGISTTGNSRRTTDRPFQPSAVQEFGRTFKQLRKQLWMLLHMLSGQPARASKLAGLQTVNTVNGGVHNILVHNKMLYFITAYHKGYQTTRQAKVIHQYLPREEVQGIINEASGYSTFLWADDITQHRDLEESSTASALEEQRDSTNVNNSNNHSTNADEAGNKSAAQRIIQHTTMRLLGCQVNVSMWRHIAISITNRYLNKSFSRAGGDEDGLGSEEGTDEVEDSPWDLQAGHSTRLAGMIYAQELMQFGSRFGAEDSKSKQGSAGYRRFKVEAYKGPQIEARLQRFKKLRRINLEGQLQQITGDNSAGFQGNQREAVLTITSGHTPIMQVMGTGGGKSVSFMLPAFCSPDGVTVVMTPLVALRTDLHGRCVKAGITSHVWQSQKNNQAASIIFITPKSVVTKGFRDFIAQLEGRQALDRVIVDECHVVLKGSRSFQPQLRELREAIREFSVQTVCLTATLAPTDEAAFFHAIQLEASWRTGDKDDVELEKLNAVEAKACQVAVEWVNKLLASGGRGKAVVYTTSIKRVEHLGSALGCATFFSNVNSTEGKAAQLKAWRQSNRAEGVVVATNALGLGINIPDVQLIIHTNMPTGLQRFMQESGRAGRNGQPSASVVICRGGNSSSLQQEAAVEEYLASNKCRRAILNQLMDGRSNRNGCEDDEEVYNVCRGDRNRPGTGPGSDRSSKNGKAGRAEFSGLDRHTKLDQWRARTEKIGEAGEIEAFLAQLHQQHRRRALCFRARDNNRHKFPQCPRKAETE